MIWISGFSRAPEPVCAPDNAEPEWAGAGPTVQSHGSPLGHSVPPSTPVPNASCHGSMSMCCCFSRRRFMRPCVTVKSGELS